MNNDLKNNGFQIVENIYSSSEIDELKQLLKTKEITKAFGVREFLKQNPAFNTIIFNKKLVELIEQISPNAFVIKSIYFDKPPHSNWIVNWHQDLTINVEGKIDHNEYKNWRVLPERTVVQPPIHFLENILTVRIHLDNCNRKNGALRVVPKSHKNGIVRTTDEVQKYNQLEHICEVNEGAVLLMKPLVLHSSRRTENDFNRRVIHIEFCSLELDGDLEWNEKYVYN